MAGFIRRFSAFPPIEVLTEIEAIDIVDLPPPSPTTGIGTGTLLCVGEFEDGPFAAQGGDSPYFKGFAGVNEVFSSQDLLTKFGGFGFTYGVDRFQNPCARRNGGEFWNGSGYIKLKYCKPRRLLIARVDSSQGVVSLTPRISIRGEFSGPFFISQDPGPPPQLSIISTDGGVPTPFSGPDLTCTQASIDAQAAYVPSALTVGDTVQIDVLGAQAIVTFQAPDILSATAVVAAINAAFGFTVASESGGVITLTDPVYGSGSTVSIAELAGVNVLTNLGFTGATSDTGAGPLFNSGAATAAEIVAAFNGATPPDMVMTVGPNGNVVITGTGGTDQTIAISNTGTLAAILGLPDDGTDISAADHAGGTIPAGTRVRVPAGTTFVTMQTLTIPAGDIGPWNVKVRNATDDGTNVGTAAATVTEVVDQPAFTAMDVTNTNQILDRDPSGSDLDFAYEAAFDATLALSGPAREANFTISARRSTAVMRKAVQNAVDASNNGCRGRKFIGRAQLNINLQEAAADVALWRNERLFYAYPGWRVRIPEIALLGTAGGVGFTDDGIITVAGDGPLATLDCRLPPEDNPGQATGLIEDFFAIESVGANFGINEYIALRRSGICAPRRDRVSGSIYQSGITSSLQPGLTTQARRKMADFIQDTLAERLVPFSKKLGTEARKDSIRGIVEQFLNELKSPQNPEIARIADFSVDAISGNTPALEARGIFVLIIRVRTISSLDAIVLQTEIGEGVVTVLEAA